ncbi:MAG: MoaD/ThiS family protein [Pyrinomonadaceae bacterium]|nr:MoaD/ThiS family protein [Chloracidobacterium sp.]MBP7416315.1 MoaD/ThiS family protein [Pyrinomonadaceae bacterium]
MKIQVLFFGATADIAGQRRIELELPAASKAADIFEKLVSDHPPLAKHRLHFSVNQQYAAGDEILRDGDELAIFTAVSGG